MSSSILLLISLYIFNLSPTASEADSFVDPRDGHVYPVVQIAEREWFAKNLNYRAEGSVCYDEHPFSCRRMGRLYTWSMAVEACPEGWRLPNDSDWNALYYNYGSGIDAYVGLTTGPFRAVLSGWLNQYDRFSGAGVKAYYWSSTEKDIDHARYYHLTRKKKTMNSSNSEKEVSFSCRCVKDI